MKNLLCILVIFMFISTSAFALNRNNYTNNIGDNDWFNTGNWGDGVVPDTSHKAFIQADYADIDSGETATIGQIRTVTGSIRLTGTLEVVYLTTELQTGAQIGFNGNSGITVSGSGLFDYQDADSAILMGVNNTTDVGTITLNDTAQMKSVYQINAGQTGTGNIYINDDAVATLSNVDLVLGEGSGANTAYGYLELNQNGQLNMGTGGLVVGSLGSGDVQVNGGNVFAGNLVINNGNVDVTDGYISLDYDGSTGETWSEFKDRIQNTYYGSISQNNGAAEATYIIDDANTKLIIAPEPATVALLGMGLVFFRRKRK